MIEYSMPFTSDDMEFAAAFEDDTDFMPGFSDVVILGKDIPVYEGEYEVVPKVDTATVLQTKAKQMRDDVRVKQIPYFEVSNENGVTVSIGKEVI